MKLTMINADMTTSEIQRFQCVDCKSDDISYQVFIIQHDRYRLKIQKKTPFNKHMINKIPDWTIDYEHDNQGFCFACDDNVGIEKKENNE